MSSHPFFWLDVFAESSLAGNGLAVVLDADRVGDPEMLAFARETGLSETTFVQSPSAEAEDAGADYRNRIWTIGAEVPFAGHPSLGTAVAVAIERGLEETTFTQETGVGLQQVDVTAAGDAWRASVLQEPAEFGEVYSRVRIAALLGLEDAQLHPDYSAQLVSTGFPTLLVPLRDEAALAGVVPDRAEFEKFEFGDLAVNVYPFVFDVPSRAARSRCFALDLGDFEDPATGSAAGPLVAYLQDILDIDRIEIRQGVEMGRPSLIEARMDSGRPRVTGQVHVVMRGQANLPG
jgi:trans-2,3-dihydro-3-hydroxyanthranilate isomerase